MWYYHLVWLVVAIVSEDSAVEAVCFSEQFLSTYKTTYRHNQEAYILTVLFVFVLVCHLKIKNL